MAGRGKLGELRIESRLCHWVSNWPGVVWSVAEIDQEVGSTVIPVKRRDLLISQEHFAFGLNHRDGYDDCCYVLHRPFICATVQGPAES